MFNKQSPNKHRVATCSKPPVVLPAIALLGSILILLVALVPDRKPASIVDAVEVRRFNQTQQGQADAAAAENTKAARQTTRPAVTQVDEKDISAEENPDSAPEPTRELAPNPASPLPAIIEAAKQKTPTQPKLLIPVQGITASQLVDTYTAQRGGGRRHRAIDIMAAEETPVLAVDDGTILKLFESDDGGLTIYHLAPDEKHIYYYAHLDDYADDLEKGQRIKRGQVIGFVGSSGNADSDSPHLHFAVYVPGPFKRWWHGTPVNPYPLLVGESP